MLYKTMVKDPRKLVGQGIWLPDFHGNFHKEIITSVTITYNDKGSNEVRYVKVRNPDKGSIFLEPYMLNREAAIKHFKKDTERLLACSNFEHQKAYCINLIYKAEAQLNNIKNKKENKNA